MLSKTIAERTVTSLGVSVGTGIALETLFKTIPFDTKRNAPPTHDPEQYSVHAFNIYTLYRNVIGSIAYKHKDELVRNSKVKDQLINDMYLLIEMYSPLTTECVFYLPNYNSLHKQYNKGKGGKTYRPYETHQFVKQNIDKLKFPGNVHKGGLNGIVGKNSKVLVMSHFTLDLLDVARAGDLYLLESHTGKVKSRTEWGSKYHPIGKRDLSVLPMNKKLLYILGDKTVVAPFEISDRKAIYEVAMVKSWTPATPKGRIDSFVTKFNSKIPV